MKIEIAKKILKQLEDARYFEDEIKREEAFMCLIAFIEGVAMQSLND